MIAVTVGEKYLLPLQLDDLLCRRAAHVLVALHGIDPHPLGQFDFIYVSTVIPQMDQHVRLIAFHRPLQQIRPPVGIGANDDSHLTSPSSFFLSIAYIEGKGEIIMAKMDDFLKNLQKMDQNQLQAMVKQATQGLSPAQQMKLKKMLGDPAALQKLQEKISDKDIENLQQNLSSPEDLKNYMKRDDVQRRLGEII